MRLQLQRMFFCGARVGPLLQQQYGSLWGSSPLMPTLFRDLLTSFVSFEKSGGIGVIIVDDFYSFFEFWETLPQFRQHVYMRVVVCMWSG